MQSKAGSGEALSNLRSRGGHGFPVFNAARLASRIATIFFACTRVSSRRLGDTAAAANLREMTRALAFQLQSYKQLQTCIVSRL